jgi:hypothetical protein
VQRTGRCCKKSEPQLLVTKGFPPFLFCYHRLSPHCCVWSWVDANRRWDWTRHAAEEETSTEAGWVLLGDSPKRPR